MVAILSPFLNGKNRPKDVDPVPDVEGGVYVDEFPDYYLTEYDYDRNFDFPGCDYVLRKYYDYLWDYYYYHDDYFVWDYDFCFDDDYDDDYYYVYRIYYYGWLH